MSLNLSAEHFDLFLQMEADEFVREFHTFLPPTISEQHEEFKFLDHVLLHWLRYHPGIEPNDVTEVTKLVNFCNDRYHISIFRGETFRMLRVMISQFEIKNVHTSIFSTNAKRVREGKGVL